MNFTGKARREKYKWTSESHKGITVRDIDTINELTCRAAVERSALKSKWPRPAAVSAAGGAVLKASKPAEAARLVATRSGNARDCAIRR